MRIRWPGRKRARAACGGSAARRALARAARGAAVCSAFRVALLGAGLAAAPAEHAAAAEPEMDFQRVSLEDGVSHNMIYSIFQDRTGFLWFGTMYGLVRFDGREYVPYRHDPDDPASLSYDDIVCITEDTGGDLWVGTFGGGVNRLDPAAGSFTRFLPAGPDSARLSDGVVWDLAPDGEGGLWVGTRAGLDRIDTATGRVTRHVHDPENARSFPEGAVHAVAVDARGVVWASSSGHGLVRRDSDGGFTLLAPAPAEDDPLPTQRISDLEAAPDGALWLATAAGPVRFLPETGEYRAFPYAEGENPGWTNTLWRDADGTVWSGTWRGVERLDPATGDRTAWQHDPEDPASPSGYNVVALLRDRSGVFWVGSYLGGLSRVVPEGTRFARFGHEFTGPRGPAHRNVKAFAEADDGTLWIATDGGLVARQGAAGEFRLYRPDREDPAALPGWNVSEVMVDAAQRVWVGTSSGLARHEPETDAFTVWGRGDGLTAAVNCLLEDRAGDLWVGTGGAGLARMDRDAGTFEFFANDPADAASLPDNTVLSLYEDKRGRLWAGTYAGLARMDAARTGFTRFALDPEAPASIANNYVYDLHEAADGRFWVATAGGLDQWNEETGTFTHHQRRTALPNNVIAAMLEDAEGSLWLGTHRGLARYDGTHAADVWDTGDGLQSNLFNPRAALRMRDGTLLFGGVGGYNVVQPDRVSRGGAPPPLAFTALSVRASGRDSLVTRQPSALELGHRNGFFTVEFAALDYRRPHHHRYRYRLEGLEDGWTESAEGHATYAGLPPGRYTFRAAGSNGDGIWNDAGISLPVTVKPPLWRTVPFLAAAVVAVLLAAWTAHRVRVRARVARAREIERARAEERDRVRHRTADDFHDELGHRLTKIGLFSEVVRRELANLTPEADRWLSRIVQESRQLSDDARDFVWSLGPGGETLLDLMNYLERFGEQLFDRTEVDFRAEGIRPELRDVRLAMESRRHICSIFKEAMNNALRHSGGRNVRLEVGLAGDEFEIRLRDDGRGYARTSIRAGNGLKSMELRAQKIAGRIDIASRPGAGSTITLKRRAVAPTSADDPSLSRRGR